MSEDNSFSTIDYLNKIVIDINKNKKFLKYDNDISDLKGEMLEDCEKAINIAKISLAKHLKDYDLNPGWKWFLTETRPDFEKHDEVVQNCFATFSILNALINEVKINGIISSSMNELEMLVSSYGKKKELKDFIYVYNYLNEKYLKTDMMSITYWRVVNNLEGKNNNRVKSEFLKITTDVEDFEKYVSEKYSEVKSDFVDVRNKLDSVKKEAGFVYLYHGFNSYSERVDKKLFSLGFEKWIWMLLIIVTVIGTVYVKNKLELDLWLVLPLGGLVLIFIMMLRVCLRKIDQYEQIKSKVEHKMAVSAFYKNQVEISKVTGNIDEDYYRFIFGDIETTDWNTPDVMGDLARIIKAYKAK
ncbi:hypothetical protein [Vreelandella stevensii]|uniref:hypothetical protein n=1 Tax=Vreelandella stevensii TaxID=502821 RepID=UPI003748B30D